jgi:hypothetical protein
VRGLETVSIGTLSALEALWLGIGLCGVVAALRFLRGALRDERVRRRDGLNGVSILVVRTRIRKAALVLVAVTCWTLIGAVTALLPERGAGIPTGWQLELAVQSRWLVPLLATTGLIAVAAIGAVATHGDAAVEAYLRAAARRDDQHDHRRGDEEQRRGDLAHRECAGQRHGTDADRLRDPR